MKKYIFLATFFQLMQLDAQQFIYPVADFDYGRKLIVLHQKSLQDIELWFFNPETGSATRGLSSFLAPTNVRMIPSGKGFSFIDQGYIKIKEFDKRSARTLPIYEPIGLFSCMNWINEETFYFTALQGDFYQIFQSDIQGIVQQITHDEIDALYPQKIDVKVFYIQRYTDNHTRIVEKLWNQDESPKTIISTPNNKPCFLRMISSTEGFYLQAPTKKIDKPDDCYQFVCHHIRKSDEEWTSEKLFEFYIPVRYITGANRLYESIEPFLPNYTLTPDIYFISWNLNFKKFEFHKFNIQRKIIESIGSSTMINKSEQIFTSYICKNQIYCGLIIPEQKAVRLLEFDDMKINLPIFYK